MNVRFWVESFMIVRSGFVPLSTNSKVCMWPSLVSEREPKWREAQKAINETTIGACLVGH